jgi:hypothetical protein
MLVARILIQRQGPGSRQQRCLYIDQRPEYAGHAILVSN